MTRRQLLAVFVRVAKTATLAVVTMLSFGCGGGGAIPAIVTVNLGRGETKVVSVPVGHSILEAIRTAFGYERNESADRTTIGGESGNWRYEVDDIEPTVHARDYLISADCRVDLALIV